MGKYSRKIFLTLADLCLLALFEMTCLLARFIPPALLYASFRGLGTAMFGVRTGPRRRLEMRLEAAMPGQNPAFYQTVGREVHAAALFPMLDLACFARERNHVMETLEVEGAEHLAAADDAARGVIICTAHLGAFGLLTAVMASRGTPQVMTGELPTKTLVPRYYRAMHDLGQTLGRDPDLGMLWVDNRFEEHAASLLAQGKRLLINFDVGGHVVVDFLGRPAGLAGGAARLALHSGAPILPTYLMRSPDPREPLALRLIFEEPVWPEPTGDHRADLSRLTGELAARGSRRIMETPGQWMSWFGLSVWWDASLKLGTGPKFKDGNG